MLVESKATLAIFLIRPVASIAAVGQDWLNVKVKVNLFRHDSTSSRHTAPKKTGPKEAGDTANKDCLAGTRQRTYFVL